jgi:O-antigen/teichoic acid export membrane protein
MVSRGCQAAAVFGTIPLVIGYLGKEVYGIWMTLASVAFIFGFVDLGIGNGVLNRVGNALGKNDLAAARTTISTGFWLLFIETSVLTAIAVVAVFFLPLDTIFNTGKSIDIQQLRAATAAMFVCQMLTIPFSLVTKIQLSFQEGYISNLWTSIGYIASFLSSWAMLAMGNGLVSLISAYSGCSLLAVIGNNLHFFVFKHPGYWPTWDRLSRRELSPLFGLGIWFLLIQIAGSVAFASDNIIITQFFGPSGVAEYAVPQRIFQMLALVVGMYVNPLWPAYTEAAAKRDVVWIRRTVWRSFRNVTLFSFFTSIALLAASPLITEIVGRGRIVPAKELLIALSAWNVLLALGASTAVFLNGVGAVRIQVPLALLMAFSAILLKILLSPALGLVGVVLGGIVAYGVVSFVPQLLIVRRELKCLENGTAQTT